MENFKKIKDNYKLSDILSIMAIALMLYACYFSATKIIPISYVFSLIIAVGIYMISKIIMKDMKINIHIPSILMFIVIIYSNIFSINSSLTNRFLIIYAIYMVLSLIFNKRNKIKKPIVYITLFLSSITVGVTILSWIFPEWYINKILPNIYEGNQEAMYNLVVYAKSFPGIFASTGVNAFFISIGIAILFCNILFVEKKEKFKYKFINIILLLLYFLAIFLTLKRATIVINFIAIIFLILINNMNMSKKIKIALVGLIGILIIYMFFPNVFLNLFNRFQASSTAEMLNGREDLYDFAQESINKNLLSGYGYGCFSYAYANDRGYNGIALDTHNEILQIASECGIIAVFLVFIPIFYQYVVLIKLYRKTIDKKQRKFIAITLYIQTYFILYIFIGNPLHDVTIYLIFLLYTLMVYPRMEDMKNE